MGLIIFDPDDINRNNLGMMCAYLQLFMNVLCSKCNLKMIENKSLYTCPECGNTIELNFNL